jgi:hypothetical protein
MVYAPWIRSGCYIPRPRYVLEREFLKGKGVKGDEGKEVIFR